MKWIVLVLDLGISAYRWMIIARILMSWIPDLDYYHPLVRFIQRWTEPVLAPFRGMLPPLSGFDLSPLLVLLVLGFIRSALLRIPMMF